MTQHICPDCKNVFLQPFRCTTCGAQKLYDTTLRQAEQRAERAETELAAARALLRDCLPELDGEGVTIHRVWAALAKDAK